MLVDDFLFLVCIDPKASHTGGGARKAGGGSAVLEEGGWRSEGEKGKEGAEEEGGCYINIWK